MSCNLLLNLPRNVQYCWYRTLNMPLVFYLEKYKISNHNSCLFIIEHNNSGLLLIFLQINKQKHCRWMMRNKLNTKSVVLLHEYMHRAFTTLISYASSMTRNWWPKASSMTHINADSVLWRYKILSGTVAATFLITCRSLLGSDLDC